MWYLLLSHLYSYQSQTTAMANIASPATHNSSFLSPQKAETLRGRHANIYKEINTQINMLLKRTPALEVQIFPCLVPSEHQNDLSISETYWNFPTKPSIRFTENCLKSVDERGQTASS